tara:strand:- start:2325 stop:2678 length:354 start_codon:yes stop_codon:yes gene_type:complete
MKKICYLLLFISTLSTSQENVLSFSLSKLPMPQNLVGVWRNGDNEFLIVQPTGSFIRTNSKRRALASGQISLIDGKLQVVRTDIEDEYQLKYFLGNETFTVAKPRSDQAWLYFKVGN